MSDEEIKKLIADRNADVFCTLDEDEMESVLMELLYQHFYCQIYMKQ